MLSIITGKMMKLFLNVVLFIQTCHSVVNHPLDNEPLSHRREVSGEVTVEWKFVEDIIIFRITAATAGWIGVGISESPSMEGADLIIAGVRDGGVYVLDAYSNTNGLPSLDREQYVDILSGRENDTHTTVTVLRKKNSLDTEDLSVEDGNTYYLLWAFGKTDIQGSRFSYRYYHGNKRGFIPGFSSSTDAESASQESTSHEETIRTTYQSSTAESVSNATSVYLTQTLTQPNMLTDTTISENGTVFKNDTEVGDGKNSTAKYSAALLLALLAVLLVAAKSRLAKLNS